MAGESFDGTTQTGFIYNHATSSFVDIAGPAGAISSSALGISDGGVAVGVYTDGSGERSSFILDSGVYTTYSVAGALYTEVRGISPDGRYLTGYYEDANNAFRGFAYDRDTDTITELSTANSLQTLAQGINSNHVVAGDDLVLDPVTNTLKRVGFLYDVTTDIRTEINLPSVARTAIRTINDNNELGGWFIDPVGGIHGFIGSPTNYTQVDFAGAEQTFIQGNNNDGVNVGQWYSTNVAGESISGSFIASSTRTFYLAIANWRLYLVYPSSPLVLRRF